MSLRGAAFIGIWHDLQPGTENEFERWHTEEHMPERVGVPGFLRGTRYMNWEQAPQVCFTRYELAHVEVFRSPGYLARLNAPTPWSNRVQPGMTNFMRGVCENVLSLGSGIGGALVTLRIGFQDGGAPGGERRLREIALGLMEQPGVTSAHVGRRDATGVDPATTESALRPAGAAIAFDHVLMVEGVDRGRLDGHVERIDGPLRAAGATTIEVGSYNLAYQLQTPR